MNLGGDSERPRFLTDENFSLRIVAGLRDVCPRMDLVTIQDTTLLHAPDPLILEYARDQNRLLLSHDVQTMPQHFATFFSGAREKHSPGVILIAQTAPVGMAIQWLLEVWEATRHDEWRDRLAFLPE